MGNVNFIENLATRLGQNASVKNIFGDPIVAVCMPKRKDNGSANKIHPAS
jgi:hypothetical protein